MKICPRQIVDAVIRISHLHVGWCKTDVDRAWPAIIKIDSMGGEQSSLHRNGASIAHKSKTLLAQRFEQRKAARHEAGDPDHNDARPMTAAKISRGSAASNERSISLHRF